MPSHQLADYGVAWEEDRPAYEASKVVLQPAQQK
jgi:hypothetical protein